MGQKNFALLVEITTQDEAEETEDDEEDNVVVARIDFDKNGEPIYLDPTDEEFDQVKEAYDKLMTETES